MSDEPKVNVENADKVEVSPDQPQAPAGSPDRDREPVVEEAARDAGSSAERAVNKGVAGRDVK